MSSLPFQLGCPVVDVLPAENGVYVLRSRNKTACIKELIRIREHLTKRDVIKAFFIGERPDYPIPVCRCFAEVHIGIGKADEWMACLPPIGLYNTVCTGLREGG